MRLRQDHPELYWIVAQLKAAISALAAPPIVELFILRRELASTLIARLKAENWALYPLLMNSGDPQIAATAKAFSDEMGGLAEAFGVYAQRWDAMSIRQDRTGFGHETNEIIAALSSRGM
jgi:hypothetical protein